jgi:hypothetical protein
MHRSASLRPFRQSPAWLFAIALFAMAMQAIGGSGIMPRNAAGGDFRAEICTSRPAGRVDPASRSGQPALPDSGHQDCCSLCLTGTPVLLADATLGVPPAPTFDSIFFSSPFPFPSTIARLSHPPRGPPAA